MRYLFLSLLLFLLSFFLVGQSRPTQEAPAQHKGTETQNIPSVTQAQPTAQQQKGQPDNSCKIPALTDPFWSNWALVFIGGVAAWIALGTLGDLKEQTRLTKTTAEAAKTSADAAQLNAKALINSERPWMFIEINRAGQGEIFQIRFTNRGRTPAEIAAFSMELECRKSTNDFDQTPRYHDEGTVMVSTRMVAPGETFAPPGEEVINLPDNFTREQWRDIKNSKQRAVCWGRLLYRDLIEHPTTIHVAGKDYGTLHETCYCYFWSPALNSFLITGPLGYNKHS